MCLCDGGSVELDLILFFLWASKSTKSLLLQKRGVVSFEGFTEITRVRGISKVVILFCRVESFGIGASECSNNTILIMYTRISQSICPTSLCPIEQSYDA